MSRACSSPGSPIRSESYRPRRHTDHAATMSELATGNPPGETHPAQVARRVPWCHCPLRNGVVLGLPRRLPDDLARSSANTLSRKTAPALKEVKPASRDFRGIAGDTTRDLNLVAAELGYTFESAKRTLERKTAECTKRKPHIEAVIKAAQTEAVALGDFDVIQPVASVCRDAEGHRASGGWANHRASASGCTVVYHLCKCARSFANAWTEAFASRSFSCRCATAGRSFLSASKEEAGALRSAAQ